MKVLQILPELIQGGVERGTLDLARELVKRGHDSHVISAGGPMVQKLLDEGSIHHLLPVHKKSFLSLKYVRPLRALILELSPDVIHVRSRLPAWLTKLALRKIPLQSRPALVTTVHGLYSVNAYSAVMTQADRVISISHTVTQYIRDNYPKVAPANIKLIHRCVDPDEFPVGYQPDEQWFADFYRDHPQLENKQLILFPGRITRWKGHKFVLDLMAVLKTQEHDIHALVVGSAHAKKQGFYQELLQQVEERGLAEHISFLGARSDMKELYAASSLALNLSDQPEPFGRTVIEAICVGLPVVAWDQGGPGEVLRLCYPRGLVPYADIPALAKTVTEVLKDPGNVELSDDFKLDTLVEKTLAVYTEAMESR
ncbi:MAG: glycosyltransferase family 4 protein [Pseudomonadales bacterium]